MEAGGFGVPLGPGAGLDRDGLGDGLGATMGLPVVRSYSCWAQATTGVEVMRASSVCMFGADVEFDVPGRNAVGFVTCTLALLV